MEIRKAMDAIRGRSAEAATDEDFRDDAPAVPTDAKSISKILSPTERRAQDEKKRTSSASRTTLLYRNVRRNPDLLLWGLALLAALAVGYFVARLKFGMTGEEVAVGLRDFLEFLGAALVALGLAVAKLYAKAGPIVESLQKKGNKAPEQLDEFGRTIVGK